MRVEYPTNFTKTIYRMLDNFQWGFTTNLTLSHVTHLNDNALEYHRDRTEVSISGG